jgi:hypothetical protein
VRNAILAFALFSPPLGTAEVAATEDREPVELGQPTILYVNFDGAVLREGCGNDAHFDCSTLSDTFGGYVGPFGGSQSQRNAIIQATRNDLVDFGVVVVGNRPPDDVEYSMVLYGDIGSQSFAGVAPYIDCGNAFPSDTSFSAAFTSANTGSTVILQEAAHTWGLEHVNHTEDILHPIAEGVSPRFRDECLKIVANTNLEESPGSCNAVHQEFCPAGFQNSHAEMFYLFGPAIPDTEPPTIELLAPEWDAVFEEPAVPSIRFRIDDDRHPQEYDIYVFYDGQVVFEWSAFDEITDLPLLIPDPGVWEFELRVVDAAGNQTSELIRVEVVEEGALDMPAATGCRIGSTGSGSFTLWLWPFLTLLIGRRRR